MANKPYSKYALDRGVSADQVGLYVNPARKRAAPKKRPTAKQLAARKRFAEMARSGAFRRGSNPLTRVRVKSPPQRPAGNSEAPSKRLIKRRKKTNAAPEGFYANPRLREHRIATPENSEAPYVLMSYFVQWANSVSGKWRTVAAFCLAKDAATYARAYHATRPGKSVRVALRGDGYSNK